MADLYQARVVSWGYSLTAAAAAAALLWCRRVYHPFDVCVRCIAGLEGRRRRGGRGSNHAQPAAGMNVAYGTCLFLGILCHNIVSATE